MAFCNLVVYIHVHVYLYMNMNLMLLFYKYITVLEGVFFQFYCSTLHAKLVEIESSAEDNFLKNHARSLHKNGTRLVIIHHKQ